MAKLLKSPDRPYVGVVGLGVAVLAATAEVLVPGTDATVFRRTPIEAGSKTANTSYFEILIHQVQFVF